MKFVRKRLLFKLLIYFLLLSIVPLGIIGYISYQSGSKSINDQVQVQLESVAILKEQEINTWAAHLGHILEWLTQNTEVRLAAQTMESYPVDHPNYVIAYQSLIWAFQTITQLDELSQLYLLDNETGVVIASSDPSWEGRIKMDEPYFIHGSKGTYISDIYHSISLERPTMVVSSPITDTNGQVTAVIAGHANLAYLSEIMLEWTGLGDTGETFLVNKHNLLITDTVFAPDGAFEKWIFGEGAIWALEGNTGSGNFIDYRGEPVIGAYRWLADRELALIAKQDQAEALSPVTNMRNLIIGMGIGVMFSVILIALIFTRTITRPINQLVSGVKEVGRGNLDYQVNEQGSDEISHLALSFNSMTQSLNASRDELDREIAERKHTLKVLRESEEKFSKAFNSNAALMAIVTLDGRIIEVNNEFLETLGYVRDEVIGKTPDDLGIWFDKDQRETVIRAINKDRYARDIEVIIRTKNGDYGYGLFSAYPFELHDQPCLLTVVNDITERKLVEKALQESEERFRTVADFTYNWESWSAPNGDLIYVSPSCERISGYSADEFMRNPELMSKIVHPDDKIIYQPHFSEGIQLQNRPSSIEFRIITRSGDERWISHTCQAVYNNKGVRLGRRGSNHDITERKQAEEQASRAKVLEEVNQLRTALLASVSHELRTPLTAIKGLADTLVQPDVEWEPEIQHDFLNTINHESDVLTHIVEDLIQMSQLEAGIMTTIKKQTNIPSIMSFLIERLNTLVSKHRLVIDIPQNLPEVYVDEIRIGEVITNLVSNAAAYSDEGTLITLHARKVNDEIVITVTDEGMGIPAEHLDKVFDRFYRLESGVARRRGGTGLGLAISKGIVEAHDGKIWMESKLGEGSKFSFSLPVSRNTTSRASRGKNSDHSEGLGQTRKCNRRIAIQTSLVTKTD